ncbi:hypothetical protein BD560DRAFT_440186 [Blakeslea trispora]|nr:hypothetical protein BD560DRAFT_440186 [Blakeslea trispora]
MASLPSPPPSPSNYKKHRRKEHQEEEMMIKSRLLRYSCPVTTTFEENTNTTQKVIPHKSLSHVRFTTEPPKVYHYSA